MVHFTTATLNAMLPKTTVNPCTSHRPYREIIEDDGAGCYYCLSHDIKASQISSLVAFTNMFGIRNEADSEAATVCPYCMEADTLVAKRYLPQDKDKVPAQLIKWKWNAWNWTKQEDLYYNVSRQETINSFIQANKPHPDEDYYHDLRNFLEETDLSTNGVPDWYLSYYTGEQVQDDLYNTWQLQQNGSFDGLPGLSKEPALTDGIQQDGEQHLREYYEHCHWSDQSQCSQEPNYTVVKIPQDQLSMELDPAMWRDLVGRIIGQGGYHLKRIASSYTSGYIHFNNVTTVGEAATSAQTDGGSSVTNEGEFEVLATQQHLPAMVVSLKRHIRSTLQDYQRNYYRQKMTALLEKFQPDYLMELELMLDECGHGYEPGLLYDIAYYCYLTAITDFYKKFNPSKAINVDSLLDKYELLNTTDNLFKGWENLYNAIVQKYAPDGCRVSICPCGLHHVVNTPLPDGEPHYCEDCFEERHYDKKNHCMTNRIQTGQVVTTRKEQGDATDDDDDDDDDDDVLMEKTQSPEEVLEERAKRAERNGEVLDLTGDTTETELSDDEWDNIPKCDGLCMSLSRDYRCPSCALHSKY